MLEDLIPIVAILLAPIIMWVRGHNKRQELRLQLEAQSRTSDQGDGYKRLETENKLLRERVENLESIVTSVDYSLNQKVARLVDGRGWSAAGSAAEGQRGVVDGRGWPAAGSAAEGQRGVVDGRGWSAAGSAAEGQRGVVDGRGWSAAGSAAEGQRGVVDAPPLPALSPSPVLAGNAATAPAEPGKPNALDRTATAHGAASATPLPSTTIEPGVVLAQRYRIQRLLGRGGMGAVYLADDEVLHELVALKVISSAYASDEAAMVARFRREATSARKVSSPHVIRIHDLGEARPGLLYLSMEYFAGRTLADLIAQRGVVPIADVLDVLRQVCDGLETAHQAGVIHRDLKPSNVLIGERGAIKIIDFGLATTAIAGDSLTATGAILGTANYMAPEQVRGKSVDARTDIYSLGALTYHLVCGRPPFLADNPIAVGFAHLTEVPQPPRELRKDVPAALDSAILAALAKAPSDRPPSAREFLAMATAKATVPTTDA